MESHSISWYSDGEVRILLRVLVGVFQEGPAEDIDIDMVTITTKISIKQRDQVICSIAGHTKGNGSKAESIADSIHSTSVGQFGDWT